MKYVIGIDLGTSAIKVLLINQKGNVIQEVSKSYPLIQEKSGYSEQDPEQWVDKTLEALSEITSQFRDDIEKIEGISFSGQMHGLVLLDHNKKLLRNAILWNDTRTSEQCREIDEKVERGRLLKITKNMALEGFTLPKLLWVKKYEPEVYRKISVFMLPKDYLRFRMTGQIHSEYSDAAGTLLLEIGQKKWSADICKQLQINPSICPPLIESSSYVGTITNEIAEKTGLSLETKVYAGGADNACGAIGAGILTEGKTLCSIGTSGVILSYEESNERDFQGKVHYFNHGKEEAYYTMGVTLAAGFSFSWFKDTFAKEENYETLLDGIEDIPIGSNGLLFTPYLAGERTPYPDANIRGSFIGIDASHTKKHFIRAVIEGITFSLNESIEIFRTSGKKIDRIVSIGGGAKNPLWLQIQADIFNTKIIKLASEQGPGMGAAILAAYGSGWCDTLEQCADEFLDVAEIYDPIPEHVRQYRKLFKIYQEIYHITKGISTNLKEFRN